MESMQIRVISVLERAGRVTATARAEAIHASVHLRIKFVAPESLSRAELWAAAYAEVLRYLDVA